MTYHDVNNKQVLKKYFLTLKLPATYWTNIQCYLKITKISDRVVRISAMARTRGWDCPQAEKAQDSTDITDPSLYLWQVLILPGMSILSTNT